MNHERLDKLLRTYNYKELEYQVGNYSNTNHPARANFIIPADFLLHPEQVIGVSRQNRFIPVSEHTHEYVELLYIYSGECHQTIGNSRLHMKQGDICIIDTNMPHAMDAAAENDILINLLMRKEYFSTNLLSRLSSEGIISQFLVDVMSDTTDHENYLLFQPADSAKIDYSMKELLCEYYDHSLCSDEIINCHMLLIFSELLREVKYSYYKRQNPNQAKENLIYVLQYMESNYQTCTLESVAKQFNFHPNYLSSFIRKMTGQTFKEIILRQRMLHASYLLTKTAMPIYEVAHESGYHNLTFFTKNLKSTSTFLPRSIVIRLFKF